MSFKPTFKLTNLNGKDCWKIDDEMNFEHPIFNSTGIWEIFDPIFYDEENGGLLKDAIPNFKKGQYTPVFRRYEHEYYGERIFAVCLVHSSLIEQVKNATLNLTDYTIGVDSGRASIFDVKLSVEPELRDDNYYMTFEHGIVTDSGIGDGTYPVYVWEKDGSNVAICLDFEQHPLIQNYEKQKSSKGLKIASARRIPATK
jgi:hypothetical protein